MCGKLMLNGVTISSNLAITVRVSPNVATSHIFSISLSPGVNHRISQDGRVAVLTVHRQASTHPRFPLNLLKYFGFPSHHVDFITALLANFVHILLLSLNDL